MNKFLMSLISGDIDLQQKYLPNDLKKTINYAKSTNSLSFLLNSLEESALLPEKYQELIELSNLHSTSRMLMQNKTLQDANDAINESFKVIILKGMQTRKLYRNENERFCKDIDFLVEPEKVVDIANILLKEGFEFINKVSLVKGFSKNFSHQLPPMKSKSSGLFIEIHHRITKPSIFKNCLFTDKAFSDFEGLPRYEGTKFRRFDYDLLFIHSCYHLVSHHFFSSGVFSLIDLRFLSKKINYDRVVSLGTKLNLLREIQIGINICRYNGYLEGGVTNNYLYKQINDLILRSFNDPEIFPTTNPIMKRINLSAEYNYVSSNFFSRAKFILDRLFRKFIHIFFLMINFRRVIQRLILRKGLKNIHFE